MERFVAVRKEKLTTCIPISRKGIESRRHSREEIRKKGIKYFSHISAIGENTSTTLKAISKFPCSLMVHKFQFDPYLCEESCLKDLCKALKKIKGLKSLNLVFRRLNKLNESNSVIPYVKRQFWITRLRLELPKTKNIDDGGVINLAKMLGKCTFLKSFEGSIVDLENVSAKACLKFGTYIQKALRMEEFNMTWHKIGDMDIAQAFGIDLSKINSRSSTRLKKIKVYSGVTTGWFSADSVSNHEGVLTCKNVTVLKQLEELVLRFGGIPSIDEIFNLFGDFFSLACKLKHFCLELSNCKVSDVEVMTLAQALRSVQHIKRFTFKVIQYPNLSKDCIYHFVRSLVKCKSLEKFDIYLRRLSLYDEEINELLERLSGFEDLKVVWFRNQSLHISKI